MSDMRSSTSATRPADLRQTTIEALSVAAEFLLCAIRAASNGADLKGDDVQKPIEWALASVGQVKVREAGG